MTASLVEAISAIAPVAVWGGLAVAGLWLAWVGLVNLSPRHVPPGPPERNAETLERTGLAILAAQQAHAELEQARHSQPMESPWMRAARHAADAGHAATQHSAPRHLRHLDIPASLVDPPTQELDPLTGPLAGEPLPAATYADLRQSAGWDISTAAWAALTSPTTPGATA